MKKSTSLLLTASCLLLGAVLGISHISSSAAKEAVSILQSSSTDASTIYDVSYQNSVKQEIEDRKQEREYSLNDPLLLANPFGTNTTSLYLWFTTEKAAKLSYTVHVSRTDIADFTQTLETTYQKEHEHQLIGLIPDETNTVTIKAEYQDGTNEAYTFRYDAPSLLGDEELILKKQTGTSTQQQEDGLYVILGNDSSSQDFMYYYDNNGVLRSEILIINYRSHRLLFDDGLMYFSISDHEIAAMNDLGQIERIYDLGRYKLHHDYVFDENGDFLLLATDSEDEAVEDHIIRIDKESGDLLQEFDLAELFQSYKDMTHTTEDDWDWMHLNTIQSVGDDIIVSSRETSTIIKLKNVSSSPEIDYLIADPSIWEGTDYEQYLLNKDGDFKSQFGQHAVTYIEDETLEDGQYYLYLFDNNFGISTTNDDIDWSSIDGLYTNIKDTSAHSNFYKYLVDERTGSYSLEESFELPFSAYVSSVQTLEETLLTDSGMPGVFTEYDREHNVIASFTMEAETYIYRVFKYDFDGYYFNK